MGRVCASGPLKRRNNSGEDEQIWKSPQSRKAANGAGETSHNRWKNAQPVASVLRRQPMRKVRLINVARADVFLRPPHFGT